MVLTIPPNQTPAQLLDLFNQLKEGLWNLRAGRYALIAGITLGLYDHILTLERERRHIWRAKSWSAPRAIFLFTRYSIPLLMIGHIFDNFGPPRSDKLCLTWEFINTYWTYIMFSMMHWLVALRVYAYWGRSRPVLFTFAALWAIAFIGTTVEASLWLAKYKGTAAYDPLLKACFIDAPTWIPVINVGFLVLELPAFCLTAYKFRQDSKTHAPSVLINTLIRDGILYFFVVLGLTTGTALFTYLAPLAMSGVPRFLTLGVVDVTVSRLVLSLREAAGGSGTGGDGKPPSSGGGGGGGGGGGSVTYAANNWTGQKGRPSRDGMGGFTSGHSRANSHANGNVYPLDAFGGRPSRDGLGGHSGANSIRSVHVHPHGAFAYGGRGITVPAAVVTPAVPPGSWDQDKTMVIGNPYAYIDVPEERAQV